MGLSDKLNERIADAVLQVEKHAAEVALGLAQFQNGQRLTGARSLSVSGHARLWGGSGRLVGWSIRASGGPATILVRDSRVADSGDVIAVIDLLDTEHETVWMGPGGVSFGEGLYLQETGAGVLTGSVWVGVGQVGIGTAD